MRKGPLPRRGDGRDIPIPLPVLADKREAPLLRWGGGRARSIPAPGPTDKDRLPRTASRTDNGRSIPGMSSLTRLSIFELPSSSEGTNPDLRPRSLRHHATLNAKIDAARVSAARKAAAAGSSSMDGNDESVPPGAAPTAIVSSIGPHAAVNARTDAAADARTAGSGSMDVPEQNGESVPAAPTVTSSTFV
ncbi:uncharacterized protein LOC113278461 [Papaver somniferum]|uniref:uncharacterized protein LOC113278461 n=1 Tax=Papaver somniferum TaxID=3469 RepID=UPI000E6F6213|nr:uncharacterized protein LOC113278461 [Papaver somniferum]